MAGTDPVKKEAAEKNLRSASINIRAKFQQRDLIDRAVKALGKNRSDFMLEVACKEAENILLDRCYFSLDQKKFDLFQKALDRPPKKNARLHQTLTTPAPWE